MNNNRTQNLILLLTTIVVLMMIMNFGLYLHMNRIHKQILKFPALAQNQLPSEIIGKPAPEATLKNTEGKTIAIASYKQRGKLLLMFSSTTCPYCVDMLPVVKEFSEKHPEIGFLMISKGTEKENKRILDKYKFDFPILMWDEATAKKYEIIGTPFFYFIENGIISQGGFASTEWELENLITAD